MHHPACPYCKAEVRPNELQPFGCSACLAWSHFACWEEHGSCPACGHVPGPRPQEPKRPARGAAPAGAPAAGAGSRAGRDRDQPWWVGRTTGCSTCGDTFVVTNRYQRFKCPKCARGSPKAWLILFLLSLLYLAFNLMGPILATFAG